MHTVLKAVARTKTKPGVPCQYLLQKKEIEACWQKAGVSPQKSQEVAENHTRKIFLKRKQKERKLYNF